MIVVDNCSNAAELQFLKENLNFNNHKNLVLIESTANVGFSGGNWIGAARAVGEYFAFVNNDTLFSEDCFSILIQYLEKNEKVGAVTCLSKNSEGVNFCCFDHFLGIRKFLFGRFLLETFFNKPKRGKEYVHPIEVDAVQGCFMLFRKVIYEEVGGFDTNLFLFYEEIDICKRLKDKGYSSVFYPSTYFTHFQGVSTGQTIGMKKELLISYLYILKKDFGKARFFVISSIIAIKYLFKSIYKPKNSIFLKIIFSKNRFNYSLKNK
jgi:GT2 family glycosyltransferase